eukprot:scaffold172025_cov41-Tisochrysis_lutea.AAC.2
MGDAVLCCRHVNFSGLCPIVLSWQAEIPGPPTQFGPDEHSSLYRRYAGTWAWPKHASDLDGNMPKPPSQPGGVAQGEVGSKVILYIHGGGFAGVSAQLYQYLMALPLAHHSNCVVIMPEYKFTGASVFPTQLDEMTKLYRSVARLLAARGLPGLHGTWSLMLGCTFAL